VKVAVLGTGLIGGSIGLAARARAGAHVSGWDPDPEALRKAFDSGAVDEAAADIASAVEGAEVVFAAAPVGALAETVRAALAHAGEDCVVSDVGSTKLALEEARSDPRFVGGHPLAGSHEAGVEHARDDLFEEAAWYLCPSDDVKEASYDRLRKLIERFGAEPIPIDADMHDRLMATVSQLPHVLANLLVSQLAAARRDDVQPASLRTLGVGPSFRDATRVAGSNSAIWTDIYLANREALCAAIDDLAGRLAEVRTMLSGVDADAGALKAWNESARSDRETLLGPG
jgi:prephenate dehydrogenase